MLANITQLKYSIELCVWCKRIAKSLITAAACVMSVINKKGTLDASLFVNSVLLQKSYLVVVSTFTVYAGVQTFTFSFFTYTQTNQYIHDFEGDE